MKATKNQINSVSRQLVTKAQSWGQVAKQLSGMTGKITSKTEKISVHQAFVMLGVHTKSNKYTAQDLYLAWSERLKEGQTMHRATSFASDEWRCPLLMKSVPMSINIGGIKKVLFHKKGEDYVSYKQQTLCRVVKAEDRRKGTDDICVSAQVVLKGLVQSVRIDDVFAQLKKSEKECAQITKGYVDFGEKGTHDWREVVCVNGTWRKVEDMPQIEVKPKAKRTNKKAAKVA